MPNKKQKMGMADLHIHSSFSDGISSVEEILEFVEHHTDLDVIAVTDHDTIEGGFIARELAAQRNYRFQVIVGSEVTTTQGHLLTLFVENPVPSWRSLANTMEAVRAQGGISVVPHPMSWLTPSIGQTSLDKVHHQTNGEPKFDALETSNPTVAAKVSRVRVRKLNHRLYRLPETGGSDAHLASWVGQSLTLFEGQTVEDLRRSLLAGKISSLIVPSRQLNGIQPWQVFRLVLQGLVIHPSRLASRLIRKALRNKKGEDSSSLPL